MEQGTDWLLPSTLCTRLRAGAGATEGGAAPGGGSSAWAILCDVLARKKITSSCRELDDLLGGGFTSKQVTEISGVPGVGKTQLGIQLAINVQIPTERGGIGGCAVYIDTEGSLMAERIAQMAESHVRYIESRESPALGTLRRAPQAQVSAVLARIHYFRVHSATDQVDVINGMEDFVSEHAQVRLIVIDSVAFHFRQGFADIASRTRILGTISQTLARLAEKHDLAIVIVNHLTQKITEEGSRISPALGESWAHSTTNRLMLYWEDGRRHAYLLKSPSCPSISAPFDITVDGIRSVPV